VIGCHVVGPNVHHCQISRHAGPIGGDRYDAALLVAHGSCHCGGDVAAVVTVGWHASAGVKVSYCECGADDAFHLVWHAHRGGYVKSLLLPVLFSHVADQLQHQLCVISTDNKQSYIKNQNSYDINTNPRSHDWYRAFSLPGANRQTDKQ